MKDKDTKLLEEAYNNINLRPIYDEIYSLLEKKITSVLGKDAEIQNYFKFKYGGKELAHEIESFAHALADTPLGKTIFNILDQSRNEEGDLDIHKFLVNLRHAEAPKNLGKFAKSF